MAATIDDRVAELERANAELRRQLDACGAELKEARDQQTATAEVLQVINSAPGDLAPVFDAILEKAHSLCEAPRGGLILYDGEYFRAVAVRGFSGAFADRLRQGMRGSETYFEVPLLAGERFIHISDQAVLEHPNARAGALAGTRTLLSVPLRKGDALLGMIVAGRTEVCPFTDKQIALLENFAAQAVIAMENARLLTETREALEQQTATAEVLQVINSSPGDLAPVFDAMLGKARRLCEAELGLLLIYEGDCFRAVSLHGAPEAYVEFMTREPISPGPNTGLERLVRQQRLVHIADLSAEQAYRERDPLRVASVELAGMRTFLAVPLVKEEALLGAFVLYRQEVRPFTDKQIALLQNFAAQAVIAMENARLITETREALERQTATAEVLQVINSSPGDLAPVFDAMLEKALRLCEAAFGVLRTFDGEFFHVVAVRGGGPFAERVWQLGPIRSDVGLFDRLVAGENVVHTPDVYESDVYGLDAAARERSDAGNIRSCLHVALRKEGVLLGTIIVFRQEVRPFSEKQIALLQNFAAQAVIAMENARLLTETREALEQQTATAEVLQVINSSPGDLAPVFDAMLEKALHLCGAPYGILWNYDGEFFEVAAQRGVPKAFLDTMSGPQRPTSPETTRGRLVAGERVVHITNLGADLLYQCGDQHRRALVDAAGAQVVVAVSLRKDDKLLGAFTIYRQEARPFSDKQIALVTTFADQAVIAMENARLITETREALEQQTATAEVLQVINSSPGDLAPVFDSMLERATRLCGAAYGHLWTYDGEFLHPFVSRGHRDVAAWFHRAGPRRPSPDEPLGRVLAGEHFIQITDALVEEGYKVVPEIYEQLRLNNIRTILLIPLRKEDVALGVFVVYRQEVRSFTGKQIALLQNFAAQAVIAMENARLLTETREALEQQTATAEVLQVINSSPGDLAPVFEAILEKAHTLCGAAHGSLNVYDGEFFHAVAMHGQPEAFAAVLRRPHSGSPVHRRLQAGERLVHIADMKTLTVAPSDIVTPAAIEAGIRTQLFVPLRKDRILLGYITAHRREVRPFSEKDIALLENFAAQAVIAIENARLIAETREALEQQTATAEVLQVINSSPGDLAPVFDAMLERAIRLCDATWGTMYTQDGDRFRAVALRDVPEKLAEFLRRESLPLGPDTFVGRVIRDRSPLHIADVTTEEPYRRRIPIAVAGVELGGSRTVLTVPLLKDDALLGIFQLTRREVCPFSDKQIALVENFAAQAVIAMENARLITETREALEQQTATAEVLQVINSSPGDLAPVFDAILEKAHSLCGAVHGALATYDGEHFRAVATHGVPEPLEGLLRTPFRPEPDGPHELLLGGQRLIHIADQAAQEQTNPIGRASVEIAGTRTLLFIPLRKDDVLLGYISAFRPEVRPFTDKQIALLQNFAAQAVIAMENARLINETREALEQQTATAEVLQVINSSPGDLAPVFDAMLEKAMRLCEAAFGVLWAYEGNRYHAAAVRGAPLAFVEFLRQPLLPHYDPGSGLERALRGEDLVINDDMATEEIYRHGDPLRRAIVDMGGARSHILVALRKDGTLLGAITIYRQEVRPFSDKQIALLQNFAAQAVIAMENARLLTETREALEQQTATAEVLQVINSSPGDLAPVFDIVLEKATRACDAAFGTLWTYDSERFQAIALRQVPEAYAEFLSQAPIHPVPFSGLGRVAAGESVAHFVDVAANEAYRGGDPQLHALLDLGKARSTVAVPLRKDNVVLGAITAYRQEVRPFTDKQIALLQNFAAQAVIAMENARLLTETREALEQQTATAEVLQVINSSPGDLTPVFDAMLDKAMRLCGVDHAALELYDGERMHAVAVQGASDRFAETLRQGYPATESPASRPLLEGGSFVEIADAAQIDQTAFRTAAAVDGIRTVLFVPLRRDDVFLGMIASARREVRPFSEKEIALLQNFAAQAVIAIENARLLTETREALEQQTATAEVLQVINSSPGDLAPVFDSMLDKAANLCAAEAGVLFTYEHEHFQVAAWHGELTPLRNFLTREPLRPRPNTGLGSMARERRLIHIADVASRDSYRQGDPLSVASVELGGIRTFMAVPLVKEGSLLGAFTLYRQQVQPFSDKQIALVQNFAAQAVIAIENARLITETREALEQQTATAEVLQVINSSPGDLAPVFDAMVERSARLCEADEAALRTFDGELLHVVSVHGSEPEVVDRLRQLGPTRAFGLYEPFARGERVVHIADVRETDIFRDNSVVRERLELRGIRTWLAVALQKEEVLLGVINVHRRTVQPFSDKQIALLQNFAAQAVIAMENARLITETREALEQQTATAEVLQVINSSPGDLAPVFDAMLEKAMRLCEAAFGTLWTYDGDRFRSVAQRGVPGPYADYLTHNAPPASAGTGRARILRGAPFVHVADLKDEEPYHSGDPHWRAMVDLGGARTGLIVPLRKDDAVIGFVMIYRQQVRPFSDKQIALLQNFAAQAVIAMENARLLTETREALEQQTATAEVLQVINSSPGDLAPVFDAILEKAHSFCGAVHGSLHIADAGGFRGVAMRGVPETFADFIKHPFQPGPNHPVRELIGGAPFATVINSPEFDDPIIQSAYKLAGMRTGLFVPLRKDRALRGYIVAARPEIRPFTDKQIALLQNFAAQAVIAMENARLLNELRQRTSDLQEALDYQTATSDVLKVISQSNFDLGPVLGNVIETALRLCRAHMGSIFRLGDGVYRWAVGRGLDPAYQEIEMRTPILAGPGTVVGRAALEGRAVQIADAMADPLYAVKDEASLARARTMLGVPLLREGAPIGVIAMARDRVEPFSEREIALVTTFADQAVIAIENARLFDELRERTAELGRSVEELKMLGEVGRAVSSTLDLSAVLSTILTASLGVTWATAGAIFRYIRAERAFRLVEAVGWDEALLGSVGDLNIAETETAMSEAALRRTPIQLTDLAELPSTPLRDASLAAGLRSVLIVPLVGPERIFGALVLQRREAGEFPAETVRLMQTLASQSVLAIQNARLFREIADKSEQLALASEHKSQFLANMSHELRTPLNAILGYAELLVDGIYGVLPEKAQGVLDRMQNNGKHLLALINDVLDLAKIEAGQLALTLEDYALAEVVRSVVTATEPLAAAKGLKFTAIIQEGMPMAHGDARRVSQVLLNLAGNAIKFTDQGEVAINASAVDGQFVLTVRDTGPGIADADQERIFGEFQQIDNSDTRKRGGTGLGLAISKRMVEMQGGMISVDSVLGAGSTFRVVLPIQVEPAMEAAA